MSPGHWDSRYKQVNHIPRTSTYLTPLDLKDSRTPRGLLDKNKISSYPPGQYNNYNALLKRLLMEDPALRKGLGALFYLGD